MLVCKDCPERYPACQDTCTKPEIIKEREDKKKRYAERMREGDANAVLIDRMRRARKHNKR